MDEYSKDMDSLTRDNRVRVSFVDLDEGYCGEYGEAGEDDEKLWRFDVEKFIDGEWIALDSYCTEFPVSASSGQRVSGLLLIMDTVYGDALVESVRHSAAKASWLHINSSGEAAIDFKIPF